MKVDAKLVSQNQGILSFGWDIQYQKSGITKNIDWWIPNYNVLIRLNFFVEHEFFLLTWK